MSTAGTDLGLTLKVFPGDVLVVRNAGNIWARLIRVGAALRDQPDSWNHIIVATHTDAAGTAWGIEGRPGGVGWVALTSELADRWTLTTSAQVKTDEQRAAIVEVVKGLLGTPYDWVGIVKDAMDAIDAGRLWHLHDWGTKPPAHVVCSSLASWAYHSAGLAEPKVLMRTTTPADWASFILQRSWEM